MDRATGRLGSSIACPRCMNDLRRAALPTHGSEPAWIAYETSDGKRFEKAPDFEDRKRALSFRRESIAAWYPTTPLAADREMYIRCALQLQDIRSVCDFYTARNLNALALLWQEIMSVSDERVQRALERSPNELNHGGFPNRVCL